MKPRSAVVKERKSLAKFVGNIIGELRKVSWPTRQEAINLSLLVIIVSVAMGLFLGFLDFGFTQLVQKVFFRR